MHKVRNRGRLSGGDYAFLVVVVVLAAIGAMFGDHYGLSQRWHAALSWTIITFACLIKFCQVMWNSWRFWLGWTVLLILHISLMWLLFAKLLISFAIIGTIYVYPFCLAETFLLQGALAEISALSDPHRKHGREYSQHAD